MEALEGEYATILTQPRSACGGCGNAACGSHALAQWLGSRPNRFQVENRLGVTVGERVVVGLAEGRLLTAALWIYLLPLLLMVGGAVFASVFGFSEAGSALAAVAGLSGGLLLVYRHSRQREVAAAYRPLLLRRIAQPFLLIDPNQRVGTHGEPQS